jgi:hypothetical protein
MGAQILRASDLDALAELIAAKILASIETVEALGADDGDDAPPADSAPAQEIERPATADAQPEAPASEPVTSPAPKQAKPKPGTDLLGLGDDDEDDGA